MDIIRVRHWVVAAAMAVGSAGQALAQPPPEQERGRQQLALKAGELVNMLDAYALVQAQEQLGLDDEHYGPFVTRLKRLQETRRRNQRERNQILVELRQLAGPQAPEPADEAAIKARLKALRDHDTRAADQIRRAYDALDEVLDARQQARFRMFEEAIERRKLDLLVRARERAARQGADRR